MTESFCCPKGSWPRLQVNYKPQGTKLEVAGTSLYNVGKKGDKPLFMVSDIYGSESGYHEAIADTWASFGYDVYLPQLLTKLYDGDFDIPKIMEVIVSQDYETVKARFAGVVNYIHSQGYKSFYVLSFCWGVWYAFKMAAEFDSIIAIGGMHPALAIEQLMGGDVKKLTDQSKSPAFFFPAGNDAEDIKPEGELTKLLQQKFGQQRSGSHEFPDMLHGWTTRGDIKDEKVKRDVEKAIDLCKHFFEKFA